MADWVVIARRPSSVLLLRAVGPFYQVSMVVALQGVLAVPGVMGLLDHGMSVLQSLPGVLGWAVQPLAGVYSSYAGANAAAMSLFAPAEQVLLVPVLIVAGWNGRREARSILGGSPRAAAAAVARELLSKQHPRVPNHTGRPTKLAVAAAQAARERASTPAASSPG